MSLNVDLNIDPEKNKKKIEEDDSLFPEHVPVVPFDVQKEREKALTRACMVFFNPRTG